MPKLHRQFFEKPWGVEHLPVMFGSRPGERIGEIWYTGEGGEDLPVLVKYLFTSEPLSVQVHPSDAEARARGARRGKEECWYIVDCAADARIGVGLKEAMSRTLFQAAVRDGSIIDRMNWMAVKPGDFFFIPAGTIHAIGAGITLLEIQQNSDITYRLYDYGRPRTLHVEEGEAVSRLDRHGGIVRHAPSGADAVLLSDGEAPFALRQIRMAGPREALAIPRGERSWFVPLTGRGDVDGQSYVPGDCWLLSGSERIAVAEPGTALIATA